MSMWLVELCAPPQPPYHSGLTAAEMPRDPGTSMCGQFLVAGVASTTRIHPGFQVGADLCPAGRGRGGRGKGRPPFASTTLPPAC